MLDPLISSYLIRLLNENDHVFKEYLKRLISCLNKIFPDLTQAQHLSCQIFSDFKRLNNLGFQVKVQL